MINSSTLVRFVTTLIVFLSPLISFSQDCELDFTYGLTGSNMTIMIRGGALENDILNNGDSIGAFMYLNDVWVCVGSVEWTGEQQVLAVWGNDFSSEYLDGLMPLDTIRIKAQSAGVVYDVSYSPTAVFYQDGVHLINLSLIHI